MAELRTFVFTDLVGSVDLKSEMPGGSDAERDMAFVTQILTPHRDRIEGFAVDFGGRVVSTAGDGHFLVFADAASAARWAIEIIRSHETHPLCSPSGTQAAVRISMHLGSPQIDPRDPHNFIGKAVDYAARLNDFSASGQILISRAARAILEDAGLNGVNFYDHGKRSLKGIGEVEVHEMLFDGRPHQETRRTPKPERAREWTTNMGTIGYSKVAGLLPDGALPESTTTKRLTRLGNYELGELVGAGGMGDVFKAKHSQFGRLRAVKVIKPHLVAAGQQDIVKRFYQEIKAIGGLEHPNIVVAIDSSMPEDETHFLVMEYVDGTGAGDLVERFGPMSIANACEIARQTALGLEYIATRGMVHRDIKPSNLMVTTVASPHLLSTGETPTHSNEQPLVKILDLGLALLVGDDHERLTRLDHRAMGTAMYMSPEQWRTTSVDIRSDIYSLGCTLYHLLCGKPPFFDSELRPDKAHEKGKVPPIRGGKEIPRPLWNVIRKALAKDPQDRFQSPGELAEELAKYSVDNTLVALVSESRHQPANAPTLQGHASDTLAADGTHSDTLLAGRRLGSSITGSPAVTRRWLWAAIVALVIAVGAGVWLADWVSRISHRFEASKRDAAVFAAATSADNVGREINIRFDKLIDLVDSRNKDLPGDDSGRSFQQYVSYLNQQSQDESLPLDRFQPMWSPLRDWLKTEKSRFDQRHPSESWFVIIRNGTQVARAPHSQSVGNNYAYRDYFHGEAGDKPEGVTDVEPIKAPHRSAVYESTSTQRLKVAFSVPVYDSPNPISTSKVAGVFAMSFDLGDFTALEKDLLKGKQVLLVDLRQDEIEKEPKRGLILHHSAKDLANLNKGGKPARISPELLARVNEALQSGEKDKIIEDYTDPLGGPSHYWCAVTAVNVRRGKEEVIPTDWAVLVQERK
ncbi:protein kinase domain-containing protein [Aeoliella mucimassa]|uniref:Serine/threonine-protein kinase PknB n=1 Tax=Aeoliella mucimassa TaxID=2527972 RepID=A0A518AJF8_9BACT|nr:protein kinase [Aeoliella mucimassa]QDU54877.1 Serine/threonine-protein kinase PknB [Aeoliella mucimassa]